MCGFANRRSKVGAMTKAEISSREVERQAGSLSDPVPDPTTGPSVAPDQLGEPLVVLSEVDKHFGDLHVLQKIDLTVRKGEVVVVLGPSGSGKSTLCRVINRLETIESGTITIDGQQLPDERRTTVEIRGGGGRVHVRLSDNAAPTLVRRPERGCGSRGTSAHRRARARRAGRRPPPSCPR